jgi:hypothetical protein
MAETGRQRQRRTPGASQRQRHQLPGHRMLPSSLVTKDSTQWCQLAKSSWTTWFMATAGQA